MRSTLAPGRTPASSVHATRNAPRAPRVLIKFAADLQAGLLARIRESSLNPKCFCAWFAPARVLRLLALRVNWALLTCSSDRRGAIVQLARFRDSTLGI